MLSPSNLWVLKVTVARCTLASAIGTCASGEARPYRVVHSAGNGGRRARLLQHLRVLALVDGLGDAGPDRERDTKS